MKIKDIRQFRTFYKDKIRKTKDTNRDEHFVGAEIQDEQGESVFGFFDLYHGDKVKEVVGGIKGFLEGFLEMAQDAQAVYEFMQNAVDANSSHFAMIWGKDEDGENYLLVANNGKTFDFASIRSILNVGVSTKKAEDHSIGKFGIGFKLAHRLVGKDNGIDELLNKNYGPVLFSWQNSDIKKLMETDGSIIPTEQQYRILPRKGADPEYLIDGDEPWLFKILITNFPTQPDESIRDAHYQSTNDALTGNDVVKLKNWLNKHKTQLPLTDYETGSLFFLKLGEDKVSRLEDENLREGIRFSLSILNHSAKDIAKGLSQVHLNGSDIENAPLLFEDLLIEKRSQEYNYIRFGSLNEPTAEQQEIVNKDSDIQLLLGYTDYESAVELIDNVPNFYLFFPLSEEKHKLRFILHSNAFYKKSARTSLHSDALNERLLEVFATKLVGRMMDWSASMHSAEREKFLLLYPTLLLSKKSEDHDREWINKPLIHTLHTYLKENIPVHVTDGFKMATSSANVRIKNTGLALDLNMFGLNLEWFYWGNDPLLQDAVTEVLGIESFSMIDLLTIKDAAKKINAMLLSDPSLRATVIGEINLHLANLDTKNNQEKEVIKENIHELLLFTFSDGSHRSIDILNADNQTGEHLLLFGQIEPIRPELEKAGFITTTYPLSDYPKIESFIRSRQSIDYNDYRILNEFLSCRFESANFSVTEKHKIFKTLEKAKDDPTEQARNERMGVLRLFANVVGEVTALNMLLVKTFKPWQAPLVIHPGEDFTPLHRYMISDDSQSYTIATISLWNRVITDHMGLIKGNIRNFFRDITQYQASTQQAVSLATSRYIPLADGFYVNNFVIYFQPEWHSMALEDYQDLTSLWKRLFSTSLPEFDALPYLNLQPFNLNTPSFTTQVLKCRQQLSRSDISLLGKASVSAKLPLFEYFAIYWTGNVGMLDDLPDGERMVWCGDHLALSRHIEKFHPELIISPQIQELKPLISVRDTELLKYLILAWDGEVGELNDSLSEIIKTEDNSIKSLYLAQCSMVYVDVAPSSSLQALANLVMVALTFDRENFPIDIFKSLVHITTGSGAFVLSKVVATASDSVVFGESADYSLKLSAIFSQEDVGYSKYIAVLIARLHAEKGFPLSELNILFGINEEVDKEEIMARLYSRHTEIGYFENASQLAFVLLYDRFAQFTVDLKHFSIIVGDSAVPLDGVFGISREKFPLFDSGAYLDDRYQDISSILKLGQFHPVYRGKTIGIFVAPIVEGEQLLGPPLQSSLSADEQLYLFNFLLANAYIPGRLNPANQKWEEILDFDPALKVATKLSLRPSERLADHIFEWSYLEQDGIQRSLKQKLLAAIGVNFGYSLVHRLRELLIRGTGERADIIGIEALHPQLTANSLWLLTEHLPELHFDHVHSDFPLIRKLFDRCMEANILDIPYPVLQQGTQSYALCQDPDVIYYHDGESQADLQSFVISITELQAVTGLSIYDSLQWTSKTALKERFKEINIKVVTNLDDQQEAQEWNDPYYKEWLKKFPQTKLYYYDGRPDELFLDGHFVKKILSQQYFSVSGKIYCPRTLHFDTHMLLFAEQDLLLPEAIDHLKSLYEAQNMRIMELLNNNLMDEHLLKMVNQAKSELENIAHRKQLRDSLSEAHYSFDWFLSFIELQTLQVNSTDNGYRENDISFLRVERDPDAQQLIRFRDPSRTITPTIEYCTDFKAVLVFDTGKKHEIEIRDVSKKGQVLLAMLSTNHSLDGLDLGTVRKISVTFSRSINLLGRLLNAFKRMGEARGWPGEFNLKNNLTEHIRFIYGPPGTGKTTKVAEEVISIMHSSDRKILILTPTNKAADVLTERIMEKLEHPYWLARYGASFSAKIANDGLLYDANTFQHQLFEKLVMITTIHRVPYEEFLINPSGERAKFADVHWDYVIFDECSMIPLSYFVLALFECRSHLEGRLTQYWAGGDPMQIPPVIDLADEDMPENFNKEENIYTMIGLESFKKCEQEAIPIYGNKIENLTCQYRSVPQLGELFSRFTYHGQLEHGREKLAHLNPSSRPLPESLIKLGIKPLTLLRYPVNDEDSVYKPAKLVKSPYHLYSAILTYEIISYFEKHVNSNDPWTIGIVCPYRSQATLINKMIESMEIGAHLTVITDTVHGFQGDECDMVFFIVNPPSERISEERYGALIHKKFLINVAISRARDYLIIVYPDLNTQGITNLSQFDKSTSGSIEHILEHDMGLDLNNITISSEHVEQQLFGEYGHIEKNIFTNQHQLVNIYARAPKKYVVREGHAAIDIHLKV